MSYRNEADRLCSVYEASGKLEDYLAADSAFSDLFKNGYYAIEDMTSYGYLQELHADYYNNKAIDIYNKIISDEESNRSEAYYKAHYQLAALLSKLGKSHISIERYKKFISDEPLNYHAYNLLYTVYFWAKQYDDAWLVLEAALKLEPNNPGLLSNAGYALKALGRYEDAINHFNAAIKSQACDASALYGKACLYMDTDRYQEAINAWQEVINWLIIHEFKESTAWPLTEIERLKRLMELDPIEAKRLNSNYVR